MKKKIKKIESIDIEILCELLLNGDTYQFIASYFKVSKSTLIKFMSNENHSARTREALNASADFYADKAEQCLLNAIGTLPEIQRAKELSQYYKWRASKRRPKTYGERIDVTSDNEKIQSPVIINWGGESTQKREGNIT